MSPRSHAQRPGRSGPARAEGPAEAPMKSFLIIAMLLWVVAVPLAVLLFVSVYPRYVKLRVSRAGRHHALRPRQAAARSDTAKPAQTGLCSVHSAGTRLPSRHAWRRAHVRGDR